QSVSISGAMTLDGELVWAGAVGLARVESEQAANVKTQYRVGSVSKPITAVALMRMVEKGMIDLDAPIHNYLPDYPRYSAEMTARQLANHMAGVRHYAFDLTNFPPTDGLSNVHYPDVNAALSQFRDDDLLFVPGQGFSYSTHGYTLLSAVMQAAGGKPFEELIAELVTDPLGLSQTKAEHLLKNTSNLAGFYTSDGGLYGITPEQNLSNKVAGGGLVSTPTDLVRLGAALLNGTMLERTSFDEMVAVQPMFDGSEPPQYYTLGWRHYETSHIVDKDNKVDVIHHGGVASGANSFLMLVPDHNISIAILTNGKGEKSRGEIQMLAYRLVGMVVKERLQSKDGNDRVASAADGE
ncbi:MAG: beta-lactamase family protein, partial [Kangiellaceae bacterium]|nr:beta-lactamase family protein [Kangiellaceae bacterium]